MSMSCTTSITSDYESVRTEVWPQNNVGHSDLHFMVQRECCRPNGGRNLLTTSLTRIQLRPAGWHWPGIYVPHWVFYLIILISSNPDILKWHSQDKICANDNIWANIQKFQCPVATLYGRIQILPIKSLFLMWFNSLSRHFRQFQARSVNLTTLQFSLVTSIKYIYAFFYQ